MTKGTERRTLFQQARRGVPRPITRKNIPREFFRNGEARRASRAASGYFKVRFRAEKYGVSYFWPKAERIKATSREEAAGARARPAVEDLNKMHRREALAVGRLSRADGTLAPEDARGFGVSQLAAGGVLGELGFAWENEEGETALGLDWEKVFSPAT